MKHMTEKPITFCKKPMKVKEFDQYLGDFIGSSLSESVFETIKRRKGLVYRLISEIKVTVEDCRSNSVGGILAGLEIWRMACEPYLYNNCQVWVNAPKKAMDLLSHLQNSMFRALFHQPKSCPIPSFLWDTKTLLVENYLKMKKLLFFHFLANLSDSSLAKEVFMIQINEQVPDCLVSECIQYLQELNITANPQSYSKGCWKSLIKSRIYSLNRSQLLTKIESYRKLDYDKLSREEYEVKPYLRDMNLRDARTLFSARSRMLPLQANYKGVPEYRENNYLCECKEHEDSQAKVVSCQLYVHLKEGLDLSTDIGLVKYFQRVIHERESREK